MYDVILGRKKMEIFLGSWISFPLGILKLETVICDTTVAMDLLNLNKDLKQSKSKFDQKNLNRSLT